MIDTILYVGSCIACFCLGYVVLTRMWFWSRYSERKEKEKEKEVPANEDIGDLRRRIDTLQEENKFLQNKVCRLREENKKRKKPGW